MDTNEEGIILVADDIETFGVGDTNKEGIILVADDIETFGVGDTNEEGIILVADDIETFGVGDTNDESEANHDINIISLLERAKEKNIKFNSKKLQFKKQEIKFVGHILTAEGYVFFRYYHFGAFLSPKRGFEDLAHDNIHFYQWKSYYNARKYISKVFTCHIICAFEI